MRAEPTSPAERADIDKLRRHVRILVDLGRLASENLPIERFLDQVVVQVARAVEIDHVKILRHRPKTADLFMDAGMGWKEGAVRAAIFPADLRSPPGRAFQTGEPVAIPDVGDAPGFTISAQRATKRSTSATCSTTSMASTMSKRSPASASASAAVAR